MSAIELIGAVGAASLRERMKVISEGDGVARFMLDRLTAEQTSAIVKALLLDKDTAAKIAVRMPRDLVAGQGLPDEVITDERTVRLRHADIDRPALLLANKDDDQGDSLRDIALIGAKQLVEEPHLWVQAGSSGLGLNDDNKKVWEAALKGLVTSSDWTLHQVSGYVQSTREAIRDESMSILEALGWALPALHLPRHSECFLSGRANRIVVASHWKKSFGKLISDRAPLLRKQKPPRQVIEPEELRTQFAEVKDQIPEEAHAAIESFIASPATMGDEARALSQFEWESQSICQLFSGLRTRKIPLGEETLEFYADEFPDQLTDLEKSNLAELKNRKEARDDDHEFFELHRDELGRNKSLRGKWEKFLFGRPVECTDLFDGLLQVLERFQGQAADLVGNRGLTIRPVGRKSNSQWRELNADVATAFSVRYRGLPALMGKKVDWEAKTLFDYEAFLAQQKTKKSYKRNVSTSRTSLQIKFDVTLTSDTGKTTVQLIWMGKPYEIGIELKDDIDRIRKRPLLRGSVPRQPVSKKGGLQAVSLGDVSTLQPAFRQDSGSLVPRSDDSSDLAKNYAKRIAKARDEGRLSADGFAVVNSGWGTFIDSYTEALDGFREEGLSHKALLEQAARYGEFLNALAQHAKGDLNRRELWEPILNIGCVAVSGGAPSAIIAPWHPLRLAIMAVKARSVAGLFAHVLSAEEVIFGDSRLFFADLREELKHPFYPEVCVGYNGTEPVLLAETGTVNDYSLMERPVRDPQEATTDVDPTEAARQIRGLLERYLELQPHERSNLSIMLYNCDAAGLPLATVNALGSSVHDDDDEMHCNVLVRHRDRKKLSAVYSELLERPEGDPDTLVASETSRNFMSKLRIGVMLDNGGGQAAEPHGVDVAFLHDVVSRQAKLDWFPVQPDTVLPNILDHVPPRWSYRRVTAEDQLKATSFLVCPRQPAEGWAYLDAVSALVRQSSEFGPHMLPARRISFQDQSLKEMFDDVHHLAEWVATFDDLLDKRQLAALGINVIRYRRHRTHGRNMIVSSKAELRLLHVLVRRRLNELSLGLAEDRLSALADRMIDDACNISGDIVLRAARRGVSAGELIGLVLSRALIAEELGQGAATAWFLLDDYAEWLGQREQGIADILGLSVVSTPDGGDKLRAIVTEAKYVGAETAADAQRQSRRQLHQTVNRIEDALFGDPGRLDRDLWLSRLSDLLLDGITAVGQSSTLERVRDGIRSGSIPIDLHGYSHIFVHGPEASKSEQEPIPEVPNGLQEIFGRDHLRALVKAYEARTALGAVRSEAGTERPWESVNFRTPSPRVSWTVKSRANKPPEPTPIPSAAAPSEPGPVATAPIPAEAPAMPSSPAVEKLSAPVPEQTGADTEASTGYPNIGSLIESRAQSMSFGGQDKEWLDATAQKLRTALLGYNFQAKILGTRLTPNAALIRFMGSDRLRIEDIQSKESALLTTHGLRLVAISPMPNEIVVAVARPTRQTVSLWDVWSRRKENRNLAGQNMSFVLGLRELDGELLYLNLGGPFAGGQLHEPHTLIAGATGSGKSVLIQCLILDIAATNPSSLAKIILIDPKMGVDYAAVERLPHIEGGIIVDQARATAVLNELVLEMDRRYEIFRQEGVRDLKSFNAAKPVAERLPVLFLVHDEFAEWMLTEDYKDAVSTTVQRLSVKARAAGIHLVFAAQRPDANVMPMQLRDNLGNRLILKVASVGTSEIALGTKGAELLLGLGHMAARLAGEPSIVFAQAPFLSDADINAAVEAIIRGDQVGRIERAAE